MKQRTVNPSWFKWYISLFHQSLDFLLLYGSLVVASACSLHAGSSFPVLPSLLQKSLCLFSDFDTILTELFPQAKTGDKGQLQELLQLSFPFGCAEIIYLMMLCATITNAENLLVVQYRIQSILRHGLTNVYWVIFLVICSRFMCLILACPPYTLYRLVMTFFKQAVLIWYPHSIHSSGKYFFHKQIHCFMCLLISQNGKHIESDILHRRGGYHLQ